MRSHVIDREDRRATRESLLGGIAASPFHQVALWAMASEGRGRVPVSPDWLQKHSRDLLVFSERNRIESIVAHALLDSGLVREPDRYMWREAHDRWQDRLDMYLEVVDEVAERLHRDGIRLIGLKNGGIARGLYPCRGCCPMGDVDVLVARSSFVAAHRILEEMGFRLGTRGSVEAADLQEGLASGGTEYTIERNGETLWLELQWRPVAGRWLRPDQEPDGEVLVERSVAIPGTRLRLLAPEDNLVQVALHTAKHTYVRAPGLRLHTDVDRIVSSQAIDWRQFVAQVRTMEISTPTFFSLLIPRALLGSPIPDWVLDEVRPQLWKEWVVVRWLRHAGIFEPDESKFNRLAMLAFHALLYDDLGGVAASLAGKSKADLRNSGPMDIFRSVAGRLSDLVTRYQP